jgi:monovalent cation:H+ antiporter-2, CPA2 family
MADQPGLQIAPTLIELGAVILVLAVLARGANRLRLSPIPLYLIAGLLFGRGGAYPLGFSEDFIQVGAQIGVILLMFMLGLEFTSEELRTSLRRARPDGLLNLVLNFLPGAALGVLLGWGPVAAIVLGGITYNSSSGIIAKVLGDLDRFGNRETPAVLSLLVLEDLTMAIYLPIVALLLVGGGLTTGVVSIAVAIAAVAAALLLGLRYGEHMSSAIASRSSEAVLFTVFGLVLVVAGGAQLAQVSSAIGAFLFGIALSGPVADQARVLLGPLRDLFAATFFLFFSLPIDPGSLLPVAGLALGLALVTALTKVATGWWAAARIGVRTLGRIRAGTVLIPRGEFSIVIAGLAVAAGVEPALGPLAAAYVLVTAIIGPVAARYADTVVAALQRQRRGNAVSRREGDPYGGRSSRRRGRPGGVRGRSPQDDPPDAGPVGG